MISFTVYGTAVAEARARHSGTRGGRPYTPPNTAAWRLCIREEALKHRPEVPLDEPLAVVAVFYSSPPKSKKKQYPTGRPDCSNLIKAVEDALLGVIYRDDSCIVSLDVHKRYDAVPRVLVGIAAMKEYQSLLEEASA